MRSVENAECGKKKANKKFCLTWVVNSLCRIQSAVILQQRYFSLRQLTG